MDVVSFARDILSIQYEIEYLREEVERLRDIERRYHKLFIELILNKGHFSPDRVQKRG